MYYDELSGADGCKLIKAINTHVLGGETGLKPFKVNILIINELKGVKMFVK